MPEEREMYETEQKENKNKRKNEEWIQKARHASSVKDIAHVVETYAISQNIWTG